MKGWRAKFRQNAILLYCPFLFIENLTFPSSISFPINLEVSTRTALVLVIFPLQQKTNNNKKKRYNLMIESLLSKNASHCFKFIMTPTRRKNLWSPSQKWNAIHNFRKTKDCRQHALVNYTKWALKVGSLLVLRVPRQE